MVDYENMTFDEAKTFIRNTFTKLYGSEYVKSNEYNDESWFLLKAVYGERLVEIDISAISKDRLDIDVSIESNFVEKDPNLRKDANKAFTLLGVVPSINNKKQHTSTFTAKLRTQYMSPNMERLKKMGKYKDFLNL